MREIKFRGKAEISGNWVYGLLFYSHETSDWNIMHSSGWVPSYNNPDEGEHTENDSVDCNTVGQFTGLKDKNGKEIYEGDILLIDEFLEDNVIVKVYNTVGIKDGCFGYIGENNGELLPFCDNKVTEEVVGNIHENSELLNNH